jgi:HMG (high mobility group) box
MSAFLAFSHANRAEVKRKNPELTNAQLSRSLAQLWKEATEEEKREYIDHEYTLRHKYLADIATWRQVNEKVITEQRNKRENFAMKQVMDGEQNVDPSFLTRHPQPSYGSTSHEHNKIRSMSSEQGGSWNPYSEYASAHYNYFPIPTVAVYPPQQDERHAAYPSHLDERYVAYAHPDEQYVAHPHSDEQYVAYPQHHYYDSSTFPAQIAPPLVYSQPGEYTQYYPSRNDHSEGEWNAEQHLYGHHSDQFRENRKSIVTSMYQGKLGSQNMQFLQ